MMGDDLVKVPVADIRQTLLELCAYIPYFEERVGGTFKVQYRDEETDELKDMEGYEGHNWNAKFPDPAYDETFIEFRRICYMHIYDKFLLFRADLKRFWRTKKSEWKLPEDQLGRLLAQLFHEARAKTSFGDIAAFGMQKLLRILEDIQTLLAELPEDAVITCPRGELPRHTRQVAGNLAPQGDAK